MERSLGLIWLSLVQDNKKTFWEVVLICGRHLESICVGHHGSRNSETIKFSNHETTHPWTLVIGPITATQSYFDEINVGVHHIDEWWMELFMWLVSCIQCKCCLWQKLNLLCKQVIRGLAIQFANGVACWMNHWCTPPPILMCTRHRNVFKICGWSLSDDRFTDHEEKNVYVTTSAEGSWKKQSLIVAFIPLTNPSPHSSSRIVPTLICSQRLEKYKDKATRKELKLI